MEILALAAISLLAIKYFTPIQPVREWIVTKLIGFMIRHKLWFMEYLIQILACPYCFSFWLTLGLTLSLYKAATVAMLTLVVLYITESLKKYLEDEREEA
jgi:uncharacterized protein YbaR (Trm112 family)